MKSRIGHGRHREKTLKEKVKEKRKTVGEEEGPEEEKGGTVLLR